MVGRWGGVGRGGEGRGWTGRGVTALHNINSVDINDFLILFQIIFFL